MQAKIIGGVLATMVLGVAVAYGAQAFRDATATVSAQWTAADSVAAAKAPTHTAPVPQWQPADAWQPASH
jgi:hypothetical protein